MFLLLTSYAAQLELKEWWIIQTPVCILVMFALLKRSPLLLSFNHVLHFSEHQITVVYVFAKVSSKYIDAVIITMRWEFLVMCLNSFLRAQKFMEGLLHCFNTICIHTCKVVLALFMEAFYLHIPTFIHF